MTKVPKATSWTAHYDLKYDAWNRLTEVKDGAATVATYEYDGLNRRVVKTAGSDVEHYYYNERWQCLEVRSGSESGSVQELYIWHPQYVDALAARFWDSNLDGDFADTNETQYSLYDANYNVTALVDTSGNVIERYEYPPYGDMTVLDASFASDSDGLSDVENPYTFTGRRLDVETGIYYYRHRYYHAQLGRFVSRDPSGYVDGPSLYRGHFAPHGLDPLGLWWIYRKGEAWAEAVAGQDDTIRTLAKAVRLNADEFREWVKFEGGVPKEVLPDLKVDDVLCPETTVKVPNLVFAYSTRRKFGDVSLAVNQLHVYWQAQNELDRLRGLKVVVHDRSTSRETFVEGWKSDGIYKFRFAGHGTEQATAIVDIWNKPGDVGPHQVAPPYKLAKVQMLMCYGASPFLYGYDVDADPIYRYWREHVSSFGIFEGPQGDYNIFSSCQLTDSGGNPVARP